MFKQTHKKLYSFKEETLRKDIFETSLARAQIRNGINIKAGGEAVFGVTKFSDLTQEEFDHQFKGRKGYGKLPENFREKNYSPLYEQEDKATTSIDWTALGYTTPVKNQDHK